MYRVKSTHKDKALITPVDGQLYSLTATEDKEVKYPATKSRPERKKIIKAATQQILEKLYKDSKYGRFEKIIEEVADNSETAAEKKAREKAEKEAEAKAASLSAGTGTNG